MTQQNSQLKNLVLKAARRTQNKMLFVGAFVGLFGIFMFVMGAFKIDQTASAFVNGFLIVFGLFVTAVGGLILFVRFKKNKVQHLIFNEPHLIASLQIQTVAVQPAKSRVHNLIIKDQNGHQHVLMGQLSEHQQIISILKTQNPQIQVKAMF